MLNLSNVLRNSAVKIPDVNRYLKTDYILLIPFYLMLIIAIIYSQPLFSQIQTNAEFGYTLERIGAPVKSLPYLNYTLTEPDKGLESDILINSFNQDGVYLARYNHVLDKVSLHHLKNSQALWGMTNYGKEKIFSGGCTKSQLYEYDIKSDKVSEIFATDNLPAGSFGYTFGEDYIWSLSTAPDGKIYGSTYPNCKLFSFDPKTRISEDFGNMVEGEKYGRYVCTEFPGKIFFGAGTHARLVELDLDSRIKRQILPKEYQSQSFVYHLTRFGKYLVAILSPDPVILFFDVDSRKVVKEINLSKYDAGMYLQKTIVVNDKLYFSMLPHDNMYSIDKDLNLKLEFENVGGPIGLAQNRYIYSLTTLKKFSIIDLNDNKVVKTFTKNVQGEIGVNIFAFAEGPDGKFYGGGFINQHLFSFDPENKKLNDFGVSVNVPGQIQSMITFKGKIYSGHYVTAELSEYDPYQKWNPGIKEDCNPKIIAGVKNEQDRIQDMDTDGERFIYLATSPTYGKLGGCVAIFEPETKKITAFRNVLKDQSVRTIKLLNNGMLALGGFVHQTSEKAAKFAIWDPMTRKVMTLFEPLEKSVWIPSIIQGKDNRIYSCVDSTFFIYNYDKNKIEFMKQGGWGNIGKLLFASDGFIYGLAKRAIFKFNPKDNSFLKLFSFESEFFTNFIIEDKKGRIFIAAKENIYQLLKK